MHARRMDPYTLQIYIEEEELIELGLNYDGIGEQYAETRRLLDRLLGLAREELGYPPEEQLMLEFFPETDGGCMALLTSPRAFAPAQPLPVLYAFEDLDALVRAASCVFTRYAHRIRHTGLYRTVHGKWCLTVSPLSAADTGPLILLDEFAFRCGEGEVDAALLAEHAACILEQDAVDLLTAYFM